MLQSGHFSHAKNFLDERHRGGRGTGREFDRGQKMRQGKEDNIETTDTTVSGLIRPEDEEEIKRLYENKRGVKTT